jgi:ribosomal protein S19
MKEKKRNDIIKDTYVNKTFFVHTGNSLKEITITSNHVGRKFGEFAITKVPAVYKNKKK